MLYTIATREKLAIVPRLIRFIDVVPQSLSE
jgi:hypothetical protein